MATNKPEILAPSTTELRLQFYAAQDELTPSVPKLFLQQLIDEFRQLRAENARLRRSETAIQRVKAEYFVGAGGDNLRDAIMELMTLAGGDSGHQPDTKSAD